MNRYLIPRRITQRYELFEGWGWPEVLSALAGLGIGALLSLLATLLRLPLALCVLPGILAGGTGIAIARPMPTGENLLTFLRSARAYTRTRRFYLYDFGRDDA